MYTIIMVKNFKFLSSKQNWLLMTLKLKVFKSIVEKEEMLVTSISSFSQNVFYPMKDTYFVSSKIYLLSSK